ncbi:unnamed protein product, partial [Pocillopora meandrina]
VRDSLHSTAIGEGPLVFCIITMFGLSDIQNIDTHEYKTECSCITAWTDKSPLSRLGNVNALTCTPYG